MLAAGKKQCPACGKYVDKERRICPECTAHFSYRIKESTLVKFSSIFVVIGVVFFLIAAYWPTGITDVEDMDRYDNFSIMTFKGKVVEAPDYDVYPYQEYGEMKLNISDETGYLQVLCNSGVTESLIKSGKIPAVGDTVEVTGRVLFIESVSPGAWKNITLSNQGLKLYLKGEAELKGREDAFKRVEVMYEDNIKIFPNKYTKKSISNIAGKPKETFEIGTKVVVSGKVVSVLTDYPTAYQFHIGDEDNAKNLMVYVPKGLVQLSGIELESEEDIIFNIKPGSDVTIIGALIYYDNKEIWELVPTSVGTKIKVGGNPCFEVTQEDSSFTFTVDKIMSNKGLYENARVGLNNVKIVNKNYKLYVKDQGGTDEIVLFSYGSLGEYNTGDIVNVEGQFIYYEGKKIWEIKLNADDIREVV